MDNKAETKLDGNQLTALQKTIHAVTDELSAIRYLLEKLAEKQGIEIPRKRH